MNLLCLQMKCSKTLTCWRRWPLFFCLVPVLVLQTPYLQICRTLEPRRYIYKSFRGTRIANTLFCRDIIETCTNEVDNLHKCLFFLIAESILLLNIICIFNYSVCRAATCLWYLWACTSNWQILHLIFSASTVIALYTKKEHNNVTLFQIKNWSEHKWSTNQ